MNKTAAILLMILAAGIPILVIVLFVLRQLWKEFNWKAKVADWLFLLGGFLLVACLLAFFPFDSGKAFLNAPLSRVRGTVERAEWGWHKGGIEYFCIRLDDHWYYLQGDPNYYNSFSDFDLIDWVGAVEGETVELEVYDQSFLDNLINSELTLTLISGEIYGIADKDGTVLLDADAYRHAICWTKEEEAKIVPLLVGGSALLSGAGLFIKFRLKW